MLGERDWPELASCRSGDPDALFVDGAEQNIAKRICRGCPVRYECLADALDNRIEFGVWGGMTERERRALLRRHPSVSSWRRTFEAAATERQKSFGRTQRALEVAQSVGMTAVNFENPETVEIEKQSLSVEVTTLPDVTEEPEAANQLVLIPIAQNPVV